MCPLLDQTAVNSSQCSFLFQPRSGTTDLEFESFEDDLSFDPGATRRERLMHDAHVHDICMMADIVDDVVQYSCEEEAV